MYRRTAGWTDVWQVEWLKGQSDEERERERERWTDVWQVEWLKGQSDEEREREMIEEGWEDRVYD